jgi:hypothetical protein
LADLVMTPSVSVVETTLVRAQPLMVVKAVTQSQLLAIPHSSSMVMQVTTQSLLLARVPTLLVVVMAMTN